MNTASPAPANKPLAVAAPPSGVSGPKKLPLTNVEDAYFKLAENSSAEFDSLKKVIKLTGDMFAFGEPTLEIMQLLAKVYNENIMRILSKNVTDKPGELPQAGKDFTKFRCMLGVLQVENDDPNKQIYVTISESPGFDDKYDGVTDIMYQLKRQMALNLFKSANIEVRYPEETNATFDKFGGKPIFPAETRWRRKEGADDWNNLYEYDAIRKVLLDMNNPILKSNMFLDDNLFKRNSGDKVNVYSSKIRNKSLVVNWVDSIEYLKRRIIRTNANGKIIEESQKTFRPYKKYKFSANKKQVTAECNNGHLCTESKLFAYAHMNKLQPKSFVAYWMENILPPHHIIRGYSYRTEPDLAELNNVKGNEKKQEELLNAITKETQLLNTLTQRCINNIVVPLLGNNGNIMNLPGGFFKDLYISLQNAKRRNKISGNLIPAYTQEGVYNKFFSLIRVIIQPAAVACPGCFANIQAYKDGDMAIWNSRNCYVERQRKPAAVVRTGGSRMTRRKMRKGKKHTRKH
jgi:hypothetical protein